MRPFHSLYWLSLGGSALSAATPQRLRVRQDASATAAAAAPDPTICGDIISIVDLPYTNDNQSILFFASDAYDCLTSVPFNAAVATRFITYFNTTLQFQSTLAYLKNPPSGYQQAPFDVLAQLEKIQQNVNSGAYPNQYEFEKDIYLLTNAAHDEHLVLTGGILSAFSFGSIYTLSTISVDGKQIPAVYITSDIDNDAKQQGYQPSPVVSINGEDVISYLTNFAGLNAGASLEPNVEWNLMMETPPVDISGGVPTFSGGATLYPGDGLNITLANGTTLPSFWLAIYNFPPNATGPLTTGGDFFNFFVLGLPPASFDDTVDDSPGDDSGDDSSASFNLTTYFEASDGAYPDNPPVAQFGLAVEGEGVVAGYFYPDKSLGVLVLPTFIQTSDGDGNFSSTVSDFITKAKAQGLTRILIDVQQNDGGNVELAFDTFKQFFPDITPFAGSRRRSHLYGNVIGSATTQFWDSLAMSNGSYDDLAGNEWVITDRLNAATGSNFSSWEEYAGPVADNGDDFSLTERYNLSSVVFDASAFDEFDPYGFNQDDPVVTTRPFDAASIRILTDGICSSACSLMVEMMTQQAGVRTIAAGGRPTTGPMQATGGGRGAIAYSTDFLDYDIFFASLANDTADNILPDRSDTGMAIYFSGFNLRDQIRLGDPVPLQFKYEAADCRIWYTSANIYNMTQLWFDAIRASFDDSSFCVQNSTGFATASSNSTSTNPAPSPSPISPQASFPSVQGDPLDIPLDANYTGYTLEDGGAAPPSKSQILPCNANNQCGSVGLSCVLNQEVSCGGQSVSRNLCLPSCNNRVGSNGCPGSSSCVLNAKQSSKFNSQKSKLGGAVSLGVELLSGVCQLSQGSQGTPGICAA